jgi:hypothetical protein
MTGTNSDALAFSPRRFGVVPLLQNGRGKKQLQAENNTSFSPQQPQVVATRLTQKELKEPLGHSPIRDAGKARFGIMTDRSNEIQRTAGKATPRGETMASLLHGADTSNPNSSASSPRSARTQLGNSTSNGSNDIVTGLEGSPARMARANATSTTFSALPGGSESLSTWRFGQVVKSTETAQSIISPRFPETHVVASPERQRSQRRFGYKNMKNTQGEEYENYLVDASVRVEPSSLPAAAKPTKEGVQNRAAFPGLLAKDTVKSLMNSAGALQPDNLKESSQKVNLRDETSLPVCYSPGKRVNANTQEILKREELVSARSATIIINPNASPTRVDQSQTSSFGLPSARKDLSPPSLRRLTDSKNYGDEPSAGQLVLEPNHATISRLLTQKSLTTAEDAFAWNNRCMWGLNEEEAKLAFEFALDEARMNQQEEWERCGIVGRNVEDEVRAVSLQEFKKSVDKLFP